MLSFEFDTCLNLHLYQDGLPLGELSAGLSWGGADLLAERPCQVEVTGLSAAGIFPQPGGGALRLDLSLDPGLDRVFIRACVCNTGQAPLSFDRLAAPRLHLASQAFPPPTWTLQGAAVGWGQDFAFELPPGFSRDNFLGHLQDAEGGGIPVVYFWNKDRGLALMHVEAQPKDWYLPASADQDGICAALELRQPVTLHPGESFSGLETVVSLHRGDFFEPLALYRQLLAARGLQAPPPAPAGFEPGWCSWGYEFDVRPAEVTGVLPVLGELGIRWLTLDDRWFDAYGDWQPRPDTFPGGAADMLQMTAEVHRAGAFAQIWWYPLCAEDGHGAWESHAYGVSALVKAHPDWLILNADGTVARNNRHLAMLCPALPAVQAHVRALTLRFIQDWGFDGHKLDNIYTLPPCYNPAHHHARPEESSEALAQAYRLIFETTRRLRPNSVTQICPCGTPLTFSLLPYTDQPVTADPTSSAQVRQRIKFYKALCGPGAAVSADHVELTDLAADFASQVGAGGVPATKFIWPGGGPVQERLKEVWDLPPAKKAAWQKWLDIYRQHRPAEGQYLNYYDLAFDFPEAHAIRKDGKMYYAFFARCYAGQVELRGLEKRPYRLYDYINGRELGTLDAAQAGEAVLLDVAFEGALLLVAL